MAGVIIKLMKKKLLTLSFHPPKVIIPTTHTVLHAIDNKAKAPVMRFLVAATKIGKARLTPITMPYIALVLSA